MAFLGVGMITPLIFIIDSLLNQHDLLHAKVVGILGILKNPTAIRSALPKTNIVKSLKKKEKDFQLPFLLHDY